MQEIIPAGTAVAPPDEYLGIELPRVKVTTYRDGGEQWHWKLSFGDGRLAVSSAGGYASRQQAVRAFVMMVSYTVSTFINEDEVVYWLKRASDPVYARAEAIAEFNRRMEATGKTGKAAYTPPALSPPVQRRVR